jgi:FKBP-type peptidyl-prolyl cis-trans isomerase
MVPAMKHPTPLISLALGCVLAGRALADSTPPAPTPAPTPMTAPATETAPAPLSEEESSYLFGLTLGEQIRGIGAADKVEQQSVLRGLKAGLDGQKSSPEQRRHLMEYARASMAAQSERNREAAKDFLARNEKAKGVHTTPSGLQYQVLSAGDAKAASPQPNDQVEVQYRGTLIDGTEFDSSYSRGVPATFALNGVIKGWQEGLALMKPGAKYKLFVPPDLAYGATARPGIPGNSLLIFEVELLSVKQAANAATPGASGGAKPASSVPAQRKGAASTSGAAAPAAPAVKSTTQP